MEKNKIFLLIGLFWLVIILGFVGYKEFTLQTGQEILLKTQPVDPRDLFRGDYVILTYEITRIAPSSFGFAANEINENDKVYVSLDNMEGYGVIKWFSKQIPQEGIFIEGKVTRVNGDSVWIEYGIESYFVPEGKGYEIERARGRNLDVKVAIDDFGNAVIKALLVDGKEVNFK